MRNFFDLHPAALILYFAAVLFISMFVMHPVFILISLAGAIAACALLCGAQAFKSWPFYALIFVVTAVTNPLLTHRGQTVLFYLGLRPITLEAALYGIALAALMISVLLWCRCFSTVMTSDKLVYLTGRAAPKISLVLVVTLRFIPMFIEQIKSTARTQKAMGAAAGPGFAQKIKGAAAILVSNVSRVLENSMETADGLLARGYGAARRSSYTLFRMSARSAMFAIVSAVLIAPVIISSALGALEFNYYPSVGTIKLGAAEITAYAAYALLVFMPAVIEAGGRIKWKYYISAI